MKYQAFLFSQLFMNHIENNKTQYQDIEYDLIYGEVLRHQNSFINSNYNLNERSEYECISVYLLNEVK